MKKFLLILLCPPLFLLLGLGHGLLISRLVRGREPWFTLGVLCGLAATIALLAWAGGIPTPWALWTFAGAAVFYLATRLLFGRGSSLEMLVPAHILALLALLAWPPYEQVRKKTARLSSSHVSAAAHSPLCRLGYQTSTASSSSTGFGTGAGLAKS